MPALSLYQQRRRAGQCVDCGKAAPGKACRCPKHALAERKRDKVRRLALAAAGTCQRCRKLPAVQGGICNGCRKKLPTLPSSKRPNVTHAKRAARWECKACGENMPSDLFKNCETCRKDAADATKAKRMELFAQGLCRCGRKLAKNDPATTDIQGRPLRKLPRIATRCAVCRTRRRRTRATTPDKLKIEARIAAMAEHADEDIAA